MSSLPKRLVVCSALAVLLGCQASPSSPDVETQITRGSQLMEQGKHAEAIPYLERALASSLGSEARSDVYTMIGNCHSELEQFEESLRYHDLAIKENPANHKAYVNKGVVCRLMGDYDTAATCYEKALELAPDYAELHASLGALAIFREQYAEAVEHLEKSIELDNQLPVAHSNLAIAYAAVGRFDDADESLKRAILRGYKQPEVIRERIDQLRSLQSQSK